MPEQQLYIEELESISQPGFGSIKNLATSRLRAKQLIDGNLVERSLFVSLKRGTAILDTEDQVDAYMHAFGSKHYRKCMVLFDKLPSDILSVPFDIIDWACGGGVSIVSAFDFLNAKNISLDRVRQISLLEPSSSALQRAKQNAEHLFPDSFIRTVHKRFEQLEECDFEGKVGVPRVHLFSNILDLNIFDDALFVQKFCRLLRSVSFRNDETFICVSPAYRQCLKDRFNNFLNRIIDEERWVSTPLCEMKCNSPSMYALMTRVQNQRLLNKHLERSESCDLNIDIHELAAANDAQGLRSMLQSGENPDKLDDEGWPLLVLASKYGAIDVVSILLDSGANVDQPNKQGATALYFAAKYDHLNIVNLLIDQNADLEKCPINSQRSPLFIAVKGNCLDVASILINNGADVDSQDAWGQTPLLCAVMSRNVELASLLLDAGASAKTASIDNITPLSVARAHKDDELLRLLSKYIT